MWVNGKVYYQLYDSQGFVKHLGCIPKADANIIAAAITE
jgi:hypothetical protein